MRRMTNNGKKKIVWISSCAPSKTAKEAGGQTFCYYFNRFLNSGEFEIRLISLGDQAKAEELNKEFMGTRVDFIFSGGGLKDKIKKITNIDSSLNPWTKYAGLISNYCATEMLRILKGYRNEGFEPEFIILEWTNTVVLAKQVKKILPNCKIVASEHDVTFVGYQRKAAFYTGLKGVIWKIRFQHEKKVELESLKIAHLVLPHNNDNKKILIEEGLSPDKIQWLVPYYYNMNFCNRRSNRRDVLFFGAMARQENVLSAIWFIENVLPRLTDLDIRFIVLGSNPDEILRKYESDRVIITGFVDCIDPYFEESMCLVAPLVLGAGIKVKVLEAMSSGIPVLTNKIGIEGIAAEPDKEFKLCITPEDYEKVIRELHAGIINDKDISCKAKKLINTTFNVERSFDSYKFRLISWGDK